MKADKSNYHAYNNNLRKFANTNRHKATKAEACIWKYILRAKKMKGYGFKRQRPVLNYIADFMCQELKLIIEIDGSSHDSPEAFEKDQLRQKKLEQAGFTVIRFTNSDVLTQMDSVRKAIAATISHIENEH